MRHSKIDSKVVENGHERTYILFCTQDLVQWHSDGINKSIAKLCVHIYHELQNTVNSRGKFPQSDFKVSECVAVWPFAVSR